MTHSAPFVLVHGAYHGAWCWDRLIPALRDRGRLAFAVDLPCDDATAGFDEYVGAVTSVIDRHGLERPVAVGHSLGGFTIPLVNAVRPLGRIVFLCTAPVLGGERGEELRARMVTDDYAVAARFRDDAGRSLNAPADARRAFYDVCDEATAAWALARLRPQGPRILADPWPLVSWPSCPRSVILTRDDRAVRFDAARDAARIILDGGDPVVLGGGHSPFLSRPSELADALVAITS